MIIQAVRREIIVAERPPRVGELISSRHPGLFDADEFVQDTPPWGPFYSLQRVAWLLDRPIPWISERVRTGVLIAHRVESEIVITYESIARMLRETPMLEAIDWCCRVEEVRELQYDDADAEVYAGWLPADARRKDDRQLALAL